jgi:hypothetical protein
LASDRARRSLSLSLSATKPQLLAAALTPVAAAAADSAAAVASPVPEEAARGRASTRELSTSTELQSQGVLRRAETLPTPPMSLSGRHTPSWMVWGWGELKRRVLERLPNKGNPPQYKSSVLDVVQASAVEDSDDDGSVGDTDSSTSASSSDLDIIEPASACSTAITLDTNYGLGSLAFHLSLASSTRMAPDSFQATTPPFRLEEQLNPPTSSETICRDAADAHIREWIAATVERRAVPHPLRGRHSLPSQWSTEANVQLLFRLRVRPSGSGETCVHCFRCDYVLVKDCCEVTEIDCLLLTSDQSLYLCDVHTLEVLLKRSFADPLSLGVGVGRQLCALQDEAGVYNHLLLLRDPTRTAALLDCLFSAHAACGNGARLNVRSFESEQLARLCHCLELSPAASGCPLPAAVTSPKLSSPLPLPHELLLYAMVYQWTQGESDSRSTGSWAERKRTLVMSRSDVLLLEEDLSQFAQSLDSHLEHLDAYTVAARLPMRRLTRVLLDEEVQLRSELDLTKRSAAACSSHADGICQCSPTAALTLVFAEQGDATHEVYWQLEMSASTVSRVVMLLAETCAPAHRERVS